MSSKAKNSERQQKNEFLRHKDKSCWLFLFFLACCTIIHNETKRMSTKIGNRDYYYFCFAMSLSKVNNVRRISYFLLLVIWTKYSCFSWFTCIVYIQIWPLWTSAATKSKKNLAKIKAHWLNWNVEVWSMRYRILASNMK